MMWIDAAVVGSREGALGGGEAVARQGWSRLLLNLTAEKPFGSLPIISRHVQLPKETCLSSISTWGHMYINLYFTEGSGGAETSILLEAVCHR